MIFWNYDEKGICHNLNDFLSSWHDSIWVLHRIFLRIFLEHFYDFFIMIFHDYFSLFFMILYIIIFHDYFFRIMIFLYDFLMISKNYIQNLSQLFHNYFSWFFIIISHHYSSWSIMIHHYTLKTMIFPYDLIKIN